jgi:heme exporter protein A
MPSPESMMQRRSLIEVDNLSKAYGFSSVLRQVTFSVPHGQFVGLLGPNGSGKSTLLRLLAGLARPTSGTVHVGGWQIPHEADQVKRHIGLVSHRSLLYPTLTALENLAFFARLYDVPAQPAHLLALLDEVGLKKRAHSLVRTFSRGMQQRLSIARALIHNPDVLLFDEPHTGLDQQASDMLDTLLRQASGAGRTIIMTTHDLQRVPSLAQRVIVLHRGVVVLDDSHPQSSSDLISTFRRVTTEAGSQ